MHISYKTFCERIQRYKSFSQALLYVVAFLLRAILGLVSGFLHCRFSSSRSCHWISIEVPTMAKIKGIKKGFKYISKIFVAKDRELEIGLPTDCKHVAHIGWDSHSDNQPSWMSEFKKPSDFSVPSLCSLKPGDPNFYPATWSSQDFKQTLAEHPVSELFNDTQDIPPLSPKAQMSPKAQKKHKRKKTKLSPKSSFSSSSRTLRGTTSRSQSLVATFSNIVPKLQEATS